MNLVVTTRAAAALFVIAGVAILQANEPTPAPPQDLNAPPLLAPTSKTSAADRSIRPEVSSPAIAAEEELPTPKPESAPAPQAPPSSPGPVAREHHPWAAHQPGSWRRLRILTESFDDQGLLVGRSETFRRETLTDASDAGYSLRVETTVGVSNRRIPGQTQELSFGLTAESPVAVPTRVDGESPSISLGGRAVPCEMWVWVTPTERGEIRETLLYSPSVAPHVLKRERIEFVDDQQVSEEVFRVVRAGSPVETTAGLKETYHAMTRRSQTGGGVHEKFTVHCADVPGGLVSESAYETDAAGRRIRWTVSRVVDTGGRGLAQHQAAVWPTEAVAGDPRPTRWYRMMRRGVVIDDDALDDLEDHLEDIEDAIEDYYDD